MKQQNILAFFGVLAALIVVLIVVDKSIGRDTGKLKVFSYDLTV
jgi:hypothetical protein